MSIEIRQIFNQENYSDREIENQTRPKELFQIYPHTTKLICCNEGEITSVTLALASRNSGQKEVSCLAGGITGIVQYFNPIITPDDRIRFFDPIEAKKSELKRKLEERIRLDAGSSPAVYYDQVFARRDQIQCLIMILHNNDEAMRLQNSQFIKYLRELFPHVHLCADTRDVIDLLNLSKDEVLKARKVLRPEKILDTRINDHKQTSPRGYQIGRGYNYEGD